MGEIVAECSGINLYSERSLHAQLKAFLASPGDRLEARIGGKVVDLLRSDGEIVEVQTGHFGSLLPKVLALAGEGRKVRVVHPVAVETEIRRLDPRTEELVSRRKSPKRGDLYSVFDELVSAPELIASRNVIFEFVLARIAEVKVRDGTGSWWRKGDRIVDRELVEVLSSRSFCTKAQWLALIPKSLCPPWSSTSLGEALGIGSDRARRLLYCYSRAGIIAEAGMEGRRKLYARMEGRPDSGAASRIGS
jgi:hypothetical protein